MPSLFYMFLLYHMSNMSGGVLCGTDWKIIVNLSEAICLWNELNEMFNEIFIDHHDVSHRMFDDSFNFFRDERLLERICSTYFVLVNVQRLKCQILYTCTWSSISAKCSYVQLRALWCRLNLWEDEVVS